MPTLLWDASALAKRYTEESGSKAVQALFANVPMSQMVSTIWGYAETFSILLRRHNQGVISAKAFGKAASSLETEFVFNPDTTLLSIDDAAVLVSISLMKKHNLNATDAAILTIFLRYSQSPGMPICVLVAADKRLLRAAQAEGLKPLNPEGFDEADVPVFLSKL